jgi:hypothetical protein
MNQVQPTVLWSKQEEGGRGVHCRRPLCPYARSVFFARSWFAHHSDEGNTLLNTMTASNATKYLYNLGFGRRKCSAL